MRSSQWTLCFLLSFLILGALGCQRTVSTESTVLQNDVAVTAHPLATEAALEIYRKGGNAVDAAAAAALALGVVEPHNSGLGGGGFALIYSAHENKITALDYRESAPGRATEQTFRDRSSIVGYSASGVPGLLRGLGQALKLYGTQPLSTVLEPAIRLAKEGFEVSPLLAERLSARAECLGQFPASRTIFFRDEKVLGKGELLIQKDLAQTLQSIAEKGPDVFYKGPVAERIASEMKRHNGLIDRTDLSQYAAKKRQAVKISYRGYFIYTMPLPSSAGTVLTELFRKIENNPLKSWGWGSVRSAQRLTEAMKHAFEARTRLGQTTHATFADRHGNVVTMTNSLNLSFGSCVVIPGTGIVMNNHMDDFTTQSKKPNVYGLIQGNANKVEPYKRPLSSMSPSIVLKDDKIRYALGSPGGPTIISNVFQVLVNLIDHQMTLEKAIAAPKLHHQYLPNVLRYQEGYPETTIKALRQKGYQAEARPRWGNVQAIQINWNQRKTIGAADPRGEGTVGIHK